ncbi:Putative DNA-binding domain-containing protein [Poseidonocella pacifica]|uniref:Putative DNA-binding domain-containing protein n=1 Tax=Poseidonocella pacifica TaxID=871651 RepID=A0A1I0X3D0_9RHOB|nr:DNA-binding domain-containing protein [Poseidonocella pacifica]SFA95157.1 Putative DNA-binding domain-containing protein [Poseidonocella pacifica]
MRRQSAFLTALLDPENEVPPGLIDGGKQAAGKRFNVYRNNVVVSLIEALQSGFPTVAALMGPERFQFLAARFVRECPPTSPRMMHYGATFPDWLADVQVGELPGYLPDMARLDLAMRASYHAPDSTALPPESIAALPPETIMAARLSFAPSLRLLTSPWPIFDIWRLVQDSSAPKPRPLAQDIVILRPVFDPAPALLPPGGANLIAALQDAIPLGVALEDAPEGFDLSGLMSILFAGGAITHIDANETPT